MSSGFGKNFFKKIFPKLLTKKIGFVMIRILLQGWEFFCMT